MLRHSEIVQLVRSVRDFTMVNPTVAAAFARSVEAASISKVPGDIVECGVWRGGMCLLAAAVLRRLGDVDRKIWLFDTFAGMTEPSMADVRGDVVAVDKWRQAQRGDINEWCYASIDEVRKTLALADYPIENFILVKGDVAVTLRNRLVPEAIAVLRSDTDWYESTRVTLECLYDRVSIGGRVQFDDYNLWEGQRKAVDEFYADNNLPLNGFHAGNCYELVKIKERDHPKNTRFLSTENGVTTSEILYQARRLFDERQAEEALALLGKVPSEQRGTAYYALMGQAAIRSARYGDAADAYEVVYSSNPSLRSRLQLIDASIRAARLERARELIRDITELPEVSRARWSEIFYTIALQCLDRQQIEGAVLARGLAAGWLGRSPTFEQTSTAALHRVAMTEAAIGEPSLFFRAAGQYVVATDLDSLWLARLFGLILQHRRIGKLAASVDPSAPAREGERLIAALVCFMGERYDAAALLGRSLANWSAPQVKIAEELVAECEAREVTITEFAARVTAVKLNKADDVPFIVVHRGASAYAEISLKTMINVNGRKNVIHVGDIQLLKDVHFEHISSFEKRAHSFARLYKHNSILDSEYSLFSFQRWLIAEEFMRGAGIEQAVLVDSDVLAWSPASEIINLFGDGYGMTNWTWTCLVRRRNTLSSFCDFIESAFSDDETLSRYVATYGRQTPWGPSFQDMSAFRSFLLEGPPGDMIDAYTHPNAIGIDQAINSPGTVDSLRLDGLGARLLRHPVKRIIWREGKPFARSADNGGLVQMHTLHLQGPTKPFMARWLGPESTPVRNDPLASMKLHQYLTADNDFDYDAYRAVQTSANKRKLEWVFVDQRVIAALADYLRDSVDPLRFGICHGTRRGLEQKWFREALGIDVIGTEISDTARDFPHTVQWDFHDMNPEWMGKADFIYSNSWDHSYDPRKCFLTWARTLRRGGVCLIEHTINHEPRTQSAVDPFGISADDLFVFLNKIASDEFVVLDPIRIEITGLPSHLRGLTHFVIRRL